MSGYLEQAAVHLGYAAEAAGRARPDCAGWATAAEQYARHMEMAREYKDLAAIEKGTAFPADLGEDGQPS